MSERSIKKKKKKFRNISKGLFIFSFLVQEMVLSVGYRQGLTWEVSSDMQTLTVLIQDGTGYRTLPVKTKQVCTSYLPVSCYIILSTFVDVVKKAVNTHRQNNCLYPFFPLMLQFGPNPDYYSTWPVKKKKRWGGGME